MRKGPGCVYDNWNISTVLMVIKYSNFVLVLKNCLIRMKSGRTFSRYDQNQTIGKPNNLKVCGRRKPRGRSESVYLSLL